MWLSLSLLWQETNERSVDLNDWHNLQRTGYWLDLSHSMPQSILLTVHWYCFPLWSVTEKLSMNTTTSLFPLSFWDYAYVFIQGYFPLLKQTMDHIFLYSHQPWGQQLWKSYTKQMDSKPILTHLMTHLLFISIIAKLSWFSPISWSFEVSKTPQLLFKIWSHRLIISHIDDQHHLLHGIQV